MEFCGCYGRSGVLVTAECRLWLSAGYIFRWLCLSVGFSCVLVGADCELEVMPSNFAIQIVRRIVLIL